LADPTSDILIALIAIFSSRKRRIYANKYGELVAKWTEALSMAALTTIGAQFQK
jgi:hypothetical protein